VPHHQPGRQRSAFSGNGTRCAVAYLYYKNLWREKSLKLETKSGVKTYELLERNDSTFRFLAELGKPRFGLPDSPFLKAILAEFDEEQEIPAFSSILLPEEKMLVNFFFVDVGNPVVCVFVEDFNQLSGEASDEQSNLT
jgi:diaminopimelate epimerase